MAKHIYRAHNAMAGVGAGELFEADENDPRVKTGLVELVRKAEVPTEVSRALAEGAESVPEPVEAPSPPKATKKR